MSKEIIDLIKMLPEAEQAPIWEEVRNLASAQTREEGTTDFMKFVTTMWPGFIHGRHHELMARKFEEIANGETKRLIINMPPRHTKSEFASFLLPAWFLGKYPNKI